LLPSAQACVPVSHEKTPFLQMLGLVAQGPPAVHGTQAPAPLQTRLVPQLMPADLLVPSMHCCVPVAQEVVPFLQALFGLVVHAAPSAQETQVPEPLQTMLVPQAVPAPLFVPSTQVWAPVSQAVDPLRQTLGLPVQEAPTVHATQLPVPLQTMLVPQPRPGALLVSSTQVWPPVAQDVAPFRQMLGLVVQARPGLQATQLPEPLQTMLLPQLVPPAFGVPLAQVCAPLMHDATPLKQGLGLPEQLCPSVHIPQKPCPSHT
jgi:hypothetical protein